MFKYRCDKICKNIGFVAYFVFVLVILYNIMYIGVTHVEETRAEVIENNISIEN